ncbi:hypothetical protein PG996_007822 [Apiospora saccharicola]|uniref:Heterokaryon incompatibility domain-containing protein n=1 Tax=Apiospora saccharicola TaxID=335842 RepID=A0ABR1UYN1_9PEZI
MLLASKCKLCQALGYLLRTDARVHGRPCSLVCSSMQRILNSRSMKNKYSTEPRFFPVLHFVTNDRLPYLGSLGYFLIQDWSNNCLVVDACRSSSGTCGDVLWPRTILPDKIDMQYISSIISTCSANHDDCRIYGTQVEGLSVIDCMTSNIILAPPDCQYLALSYVWGATGEKKDTFPKVVQDSITVAKELGYKYLWVDRYCIDQDATHQQHIFNQMHRIYSGASVTIIAAAGNDAEHGLPGVSVRRPDQISLQFDYLHLTQILPYDETDIVGSTWNTRAWTYQESYFSTRRLIFTEKQTGRGIASRNGPIKLSRF